MPTLQDVLRGRDLSFLKMVANAWRLDLSAPDVATYLPQLVNGILAHPWQDEVLASFPADVQSALQALLVNEGRLGWALFTRRCGEVRPFGPGKREKERPDLNPISPAEYLWYRALVGRAFLQTPGEREMQEYAFIPDDLLEHLQPLIDAEQAPPGRPASPGESAHPHLATDRILDHACTLLAALRCGMALDDLPTPGWILPPAALLDLLRAAGLVDPAGLPVAEAARAFLEAPRAQALAQLARAWIDAAEFNELRQLPGLKFEGEWVNDPLTARQAVLGHLGSVPAEGWWSLSGFVRAIHERDPDFQRPAGDYDSWFIRREDSETYLRGPSAWDEVDGALLRSLVTGPLHSLGLLDLAGPSTDAPPAAFRYTAWAADLLHGQPPAGLPVEQGAIQAGSTGRLSVPRLTPRAVRYQIARFCQWEEAELETYHYRITPAGLERAAAQGLRPRQMLALLRKHAALVPPLLAQALERWESAGTQARLEQVVLLRLSSPEILTALRKSRAARYIVEEISPSTVLVRAGAEEKIREALLELGYLGG